MSLTTSSKILTSSWLATSLQCSKRVLRIPRQLDVMPTSHNVAAVCLHTNEDDCKTTRVSLLLSKFRYNLPKVQIIYMYQHPKIQGIEKKVAKHNSIITTSVPTEDGPQKTQSKERGKKHYHNKNNNNFAGPLT